MFKSIQARQDTFQQQVLERLPAIAAAPLQVSLAPAIQCSVPQSQSFLAIHGVDSQAAHVSQPLRLTATETQSVIVVTTAAPLSATHSQVTGEHAQPVSTSGPVLLIDPPDTGETLHSSVGSTDPDPQQQPVSESQPPPVTTAEATVPVSVALTSVAAPVQSVPPTERVGPSAASTESPESDEVAFASRFEIPAPDTTATAPPRDS